MGRDKALIEVRGQSMIASAARKLSSVTDEILISANDPDRYKSFGMPVVLDLFRGQGPLAGLHAAMSRTRRPLVLLLACDLPRVDAGFLRRLIDSSRGFDAVIPCSSDGVAHPLCAAYLRTCLPFVEKALAQRNNKMTAFLKDDSLKVCWLSPDKGGFADADLANLNSPKDLEEYLGSLADKKSAISSK